MSKHSIPFQILKQGVENFGTPLWLYDQKTIESRIQEMQIFDVVRYAQKASSNLSILALMRQRGVLVDAVSAGEIVRALKAGYRSGAMDPSQKTPQIVYTADVFDTDALALVKEHQIVVNIGSPSMIEQLGQAGVKTELILRVNPGFGHGHSRKTNTGGDLSKHGVWFSQIKDCVKRAQKYGLWITGLHMHIGSGADFEHLTQVSSAMLEASRYLGGHLKMISAGGGLPVSYKEAEPRPAIDVSAYYKLWDQTRKRIEESVGHSVSLEVEPGRYLLAESGYLLAEIRAIKKQGDKLFYLVDAGFTDLLRPSLYGSYHQISVIPKDNREIKDLQQVIVGGPLCESGDVFTQEEGGFVVTRELPMAKEGDFLLFHDTGAYGASMSSNYNSRLLAPELLYSDGELKLIRKRQSFEHLLANDILVDF